MSDNADDAATAALYALALSKPGAFEHMGLIYGDDFRRTPTQSRNKQGEVKGRFRIPAGSLRALFHNHPTDPRASKDPQRQQFSRDDIEQAKRLGVPSYISAGDQVFRYDPSTGRDEEVLAQFPIEEWRSHIMRTMLGRSPDDPRGAYR